MLTYISTIILSFFFISYSPQLNFEYNCYNHSVMFPIQKFYWNYYKHIKLRRSNIYDTELPTLNHELFPHFSSFMFLSK